MSRKFNAKYVLFLNFSLMLYSSLGIFAKLASKEYFFSLKFFLLYSIVLGGLVLYAIVWQQIIKKLPLTTAFANKAITVVWGMLWGYIFFDEDIGVGKIIGTLLVVSGIVLFALSDRNVYNE